jgi:hypothetical protein
MNSAQIFIEMLQYPNAPKIYRELRKLYKTIGKPHESDAFSYLLEYKFKEITDDNDNNSGEEP